MQGNVGMVHEMEEGLFAKFIEIVILHAVRLLIYEFVSPVYSFRLPRFLVAESLRGSTSTHGTLLTLRLDLELGTGPNAQSALKFCIQVQPKMSYMFCT